MPANRWRSIADDLRGRIERGEAAFLYRDGDNYVVMDNLHFQIFNKSGVSQFGPAANNTLWSGFGGACQTENSGDPVVLYDQLADRWLLTQFTSAGPTWYNCLALSTTADPTGTYSLAELHYGSILLNTAPLRRAIQRGSQRARPDLASCSLQGSTSATVPIVSGTRQYAGISGSIRGKFTFAEVVGRYTKGAKKGKCNLNAGPVAQWASVVGTGTVSFK